MTSSSCQDFLYRSLKMMQVYKWRFVENAHFENMLAARSLISEISLTDTWSESWVSWVGRTLYKVALTSMGLKSMILHLIIIFFLYSCFVSAQFLFVKTSSYIWKLFGANWLPRRLCNNSKQFNQSCFLLTSGTISKPREGLEYPGSTALHRMLCADKSQPAIQPWC